MIAIILATEADCGHVLFDVLSRFGIVRQDSPTRMTAQDGCRWLMLMQSDSVAEEYELEDLARVRRLLRAPEFYILQGSEFVILGDFLERISNDQPVVVDNDHGWIDLLQSYKESIAKGQDWVHFSGH